MLGTSIGRRRSSASSVLSAASLSLTSRRSSLPRSINVCFSSRIGRLGNPRGGFLLLVAVLVPLHDQLASPPGQLDDGAHIDAHAAVAAILFHQVVVLTEELQIEHSGLSMSVRRCGQDKPIQSGRLCFSVQEMNHGFHEYHGGNAFLSPCHSRGPWFRILQACLLD